MDLWTQLKLLGFVAFGLALIIVVGARIWRLCNRDLEIDAKRASRLTFAVGVVPVALSFTVDNNSFLWIGVGGLMFLVAWFLKFLSNSAHLDKYRVEENPDSYS